MKNKAMLRFAGYITLKAPTLKNGPKTTLSIVMKRLIHNPLPAVGPTHCPGQTRIWQLLKQQRYPTHSVNIKLAR